MSLSVQSMDDEPVALAPSSSSTHSVAWQKNYINRLDCVSSIDKRGEILIDKDGGLSLRI